MYKSIEKYKGIVDELNEILDQVVYSLRIATSDKHELLDGMLFSRVRDGYASTLKLLTGDFHLEAGIMTRSTVEAFMVFCGHITDRDKAYEYLESQYKYNKKKLIKKIINKNKYPNHINQAKLFDMNKLEGDRNVKAYEWATLANKEDYYDYAYTLLSDYVHVNLESLEKRLTTSGSIITGFRQLQDDDYLEPILHTIIDVMIKTIEQLKTKYERLSVIEIEMLSTKFCELE